MTRVKYYPEDTAYGTLGIKLPMNGSKGKSNSGIFNMSRTTEEQAVSNYINLLLTRKGERFMQPEFGIGIQYYLFEQNTQSLRLMLESEIKRQSAFWLPYITNHNIDVRERAKIPGLTDTENAIQIVITFSVTESDANKTIVIFNENGLTNVEIE